MFAHPFSVFQAIVKTVSSSVENKNGPIIFFHLKDKKHTFRISKGEEIPLEILFFNCDLKYVEFWREVFSVYLSNPISEKYNYLIRVKIENVFSLVDLDKMTALLEFYLP